MSNQSDSDHEFELLEELLDAEERWANEPYRDPDDYHDELEQLDNQD